MERVEHGLRAAHRAVRIMWMVRLRQVPPVIADRVTDPKRSVPRGADKEKWYHEFMTRLLAHRRIHASAGSGSFYFLAISS